MKIPLRDAWDARPPRERVIIVVLTFTIGAVLYGWLVRTADQARTQLRATITTLRSQASDLERQAVELGRLRAAPVAPSSRTELRALVQAQAEAAGLAGALGRIEARDANQVQVALGSVAFAEWLTWVGTLQALQVRLDACRIEALSVPGLVSVTATFVRAQPQ
jgi:general secretion pathway protein M